MSPLLRETGKMPVAYVGGANPLSQGFIGFLRKPSYSVSFVLYFLSSLSLHDSSLISLYISN